jgi:hypothetical protein
MDGDGRRIMMVTGYPCEGPGSPSGLTSMAPGHAPLRRDHPDRRRKAVLTMITILIIILIILLLTGGGIGMRRRGR